MKDHQREKIFDTLSYLGTFSCFVQANQRVFSCFFYSFKVRLMRQSKKDQRALEAATKLAVKEAKAEAERLAKEDEAALTEGLDDLEKVLLRSTIRAKVRIPPVLHGCALFVA